MKALAGTSLKISVAATHGQVGGGTLPQSKLESVAVQFAPRIPLEEFARRLRAHKPPVIGYIERGLFKLDMRTMFPAQDDEVVRAVRMAAE